MCRWAILLSPLGRGPAGAGGGPREAPTYDGGCVGVGNDLGALVELGRDDLGFDDPRNGGGDGGGDCGGDGDREGVGDDLGDLEELG